MSDVTIVALCILVTMICLSVVVLISVYNLRKGIKMYKQYRKEEKLKEKLEEEFWGS